MKKSAVTAICGSRSKVRRPLCRLRPLPRNGQDPVRIRIKRLYYLTSIHTFATHHPCLILVTDDITSKAISKFRRLMIRSGISRSWAGQGQGLIEFRGIDGAVLVQEHETEERK